MRKDLSSGIRSADNNPAHMPFLLKKLDFLNNPVQ